MALHRRFRNGVRTASGASPDIRTRRSPVWI